MTRHVEITSEALLNGLRDEGFSLRVDVAGQLLISPSSKLEPSKRTLLAKHKEEIQAILKWESVEPVSDKVLRDWQRGHSETEY